MRDKVISLKKSLTSYFNQNVFEFSKAVRLQRGKAKVTEVVIYNVFSGQKSVDDEWINGKWLVLITSNCCWGLLGYGAVRLRLGTLDYTVKVPAKIEEQACVCVSRPVVQGVALIISSAPPIISLRGAFVYFPKSTEATGAEPRRRGPAGLTGRRNPTHPVSHRLAFHAGNVAETQSAKTYKSCGFLSLFFFFCSSATAGNRDCCQQ